MGGMIFNIRLMTMSPLYPCGKPCSRGTHSDTLRVIGGGNTVSVLGENIKNWAGEVCIKLVGIY